MEGTSGETMREPQRGAETPSPPATGQAAREVGRDFLKVSGLYFSRVLTRRCGRVPAGQRDSGGCDGLGCGELEL